jgi:hypothetical protein
VSKYDHLVWLADDGSLVLVRCERKVMLANANLSYSFPFGEKIGRRVYIILELPKQS